MPKRPFFTIAYFGWLVFITYMSLASFSGIDTKSFNIPYGDKIVHFTFYFIATVLGVFFLREHQEWRLKPKFVFLVMLVFSIVFGIIIEVIQYSATIHRDGDIFDAIANTLGSFGGVAVLGYVFSKNGFLNWRN